MVCSWGNKYIDCFNSIKIIVISNNKKEYNKKNVVVVNSINECVNYLKNQKISSPFVGGGSTIYSLFAEKDLLSRIILSFNSILITNGIPIFKKKIDFKNFKIDKIKKISEETICIEMIRNNN